MRKNKVFRVFISSTFNDFKIERNALQEQVFHKLKNYCSKHSYHFQAIDLRWGISESAARDQKTMKICLQEIERCQAISPRPNFIFLIGDRYGWRPLPYELEENLFKKIFQVVENVHDQKMLKFWYRCDTNAIPAVYTIRPRIGKWKQDEVWSLVMTT